MRPVLQAEHIAEFQYVRSGIERFEQDKETIRERFLICRDGDVPDWPRTMGVVKITGLYELCRWIRAEIGTRRR